MSKVTANLVADCEFFLGSRLAVRSSTPYFVLCKDEGARLRNLLEKYLLYVSTIKLFFGLLSITYLKKKCNRGQSHYIEVAQGAFFMEQNMRFGPVGNTENDFMVKNLFF